MRTRKMMPTTRRRRRKKLEGGAAVQNKGERVQFLGGIQFLLGNPIPGEFLKGV